MLIENNYLNLIPSELVEIILSYVNSSDLDNINILLDTKVNYGTVYYYHFDNYKNVGYTDYIKDLGLSELKEILKLEYAADNLLELDRSYEDIEEIPSQIGYMSKLVRLYLGHNDIKEIPKEISKLTNLEMLDINDNKITIIPRAISQLTNVNWLDLSNNQIIKIPTEIG